MIQKIIKVPADIEDHFEYKVDIDDAFVYGGKTSGSINTSKYHDHTKYDIVYYIGNFVTTNGLFYEVLMYSHETDYPHFHVVGHNSNTGENEKDLCISMVDATYYYHGMEPTTNVKLTDDEVNCLDKFLRTIIGFSGSTQWNYMLYAWAQTSKNNGILPSLSQPNYMLLEREK